jgi:hypothetical protein
MTPFLLAGHYLACVPSVARGISALRAAISRAEMHRTAILVLRLALCAQNAVWRLLRKIK